MKVGFIGCVDSSHSALKALIKEDYLDIVGVVTKKTSTINSDFTDLSPLCNKEKIPYIFYNNDIEEIYKFFHSKNPEVIYCIGWSHLLPAKVLNVPKHGVIGFHPAKLPSNRGRHPIIWALALGLEETASTFFKMDEGADSGDIVSQEIIKIEESDNSKSLYTKILSSLELQIPTISQKLFKGQLVYHKQDESLASSWRKRSVNDGIIDFRMTAKDINNLVRALAEPYPKAQFKYNNGFVKVGSAEIMRNICNQNVEPGKVIESSLNYISVKCSGVDAIKLMDIEYEDLPKLGEYL